MHGFIMLSSVHRIIHTHACRHAQGVNDMIHLLVHLKGDKHLVQLMDMK
uniref:Uncharacterized protein n=1 Tax=Rhizophora mucronata TaxID=61149 RepID=A0A2P2IU26_RHIMU